MHSFLDQISALLSSAHINTLQNNELYRQLPTAGLFSNLLSEYANGAEDANIAALSGNIVPALPAQNALAAATDSFVNFSGEESNGVVAASVNAPVVSATSLNDDSALPTAQIPNSTQLQPVPVKPAGNELLNRNVAEDKIFIEKPGLNVNLPEETRTFFRSPLIENGKPENIARTSSADQPVPPVSHQVVRESQNDLRINSSRNATPQVSSSEQPIAVTEKIDVRGVQSEVATKSPATTDNTITAKTKSHSEAINVNNGSAFENPVIQNRPSTSQVTAATNTPVNLLDPRERLLTPVANNPVGNFEDGVLVDNKITPETTRFAGNSSTDVINRPADQNRYAFDAETIAPQRKQETLTQFDATDVRKENIIASTVVREQSEYTRQADNRISLQQTPEDLYKITNTQDRPIARPDYNSPVQQNFIVESAPVVKIVEINIDQKTPVTINIGADAVSSLKPVNNEFQPAPLREILQSDSSSPVVRSGEIRNGNEIADQIAWARQNNAQHVRISVSPEHLGAVDISIDDAADGLNIQFVAQNQQAKDALELFMPRLKEMLEQSGLNLQNASVSQQGENKNQFNLSDQNNNELLPQEIDDDISVSQTDLIHNQASSSSEQLLDAFA